MSVTYVSRSGEVFEVGGGNGGWGQDRCAAGLEHIPLLVKVFEVASFLQKNNINMM